MVGTSLNQSQKRFQTTDNSRSPLKFFLGVGEWNRRFIKHLMKKYHQTSFIIDIIKKVKT